MKVKKINLFCIGLLLQSIVAFAQHKKVTSINDQAETRKSDSIKLSILLDLAHRQITLESSKAAKDSAGKEIALAIKLNDRMKSDKYRGLIALTQAEYVNSYDSTLRYARSAIPYLLKTQSYAKLADAYKIYAGSLSFDQYKTKINAISKAGYYYKLVGNEGEIIRTKYMLYGYKKDYHDYLPTNLQAKKLRSAIISGRENKEQAMLLLKIAEYQIKKPLEESSDMDSARNYIEMAARINARINDPECAAAIAITKADIYKEFGNTTGQIAELQHGINYLKSTGSDNNALGDLFLRLSQTYSSGDHYLNLKLNCAQTALRYYQAAAQTKKLGDVFLTMGQIYAGRSSYELARSQFEQALNKYHSCHDPNLSEAYLALGNLARHINDLPKSDSLYLACERSATAATPNSLHIEIAKRLMHNFDYFDMSTQSIFWAKRLMETSLISEDFDAYYAGVEYLVGLLTKIHQPLPALKQLKIALKDYPPQNIAQQRDADAAYARCLIALHQYKGAEPYMVRYKNSLKFYYIEYTPGTRDYYDNYTICLSRLCKFYSDIGKPLIANKYLNQMNEYAKKYNSAEDKLVAYNMESMRFRIDTALNRYKSAFLHYVQADHAIGAIISDSKTRAIEELNVRYATEARLKDIKLLQNRNEIQKGELKHVTFQKNVVTVGIVIILLISSFIFYSYRQKQRVNKELELKQTMINQQNSTLTYLINEKDKLLDDKESLLRDKELLIMEIQHRVKNNLHMISSLLESQSAYLEDDALHAIQNSQHRIQAISLVHQKLYASADVMEVPMDVYLRQLVTYLRENVITDQNIVFHIDADPITLSGEQAVQLGLILNETIINSIKHAFTDGRLGHIDISLKWKPDNFVLFTIADDGVGVTGDHKIKANSDAMGMNLIRRLAKAIDGRLDAQFTDGVTLKVLFMKTGSDGEANEAELNKSKS